MDTISEIKAAVTNLEAKAKTVLADDRWKSSRLWTALAAVVLVVLLHHYGIDRTILYLVSGTAWLFMGLRTWDDRNRDRCNADIEIARIAKGFDDGAPTKVITTAAPGKP